jgi:cell division protein FtsL
MSVFTMIVLIVFIVTMARLYESRQKATREGGTIGNKGNENQQLEAEITRLNARIAVLERIATDPSKRLADEIDSLKSLPSDKPAGPKRDPREGEGDDAER